MKNNLILVALASISIVACNGFKKGEAGTEYKIVEHKGNGPKIKEGDVISLDGKMTTETDSVLTNTYEQGTPATFPIQKPSYKGDLMWVMTMLSEGDSAVVKINVDSIAKYSGQPKPPGLKGKFYIYSFRIKNHFFKAAGEKDSAFFARVTKVITEKPKLEEPANIKKYIADKKLKMTTTASGLNYVITKMGTGVKPVAGDTAIADYTGALLSGKIFDTSLREVAQKDPQLRQAIRKYEPAVIPLGVHTVIAGLDEALQLFPKGTKATLIIPSSLAYGQTGSPGAIPPFSPLVFDIELKDVRHPKKP